MEVVVGLDMGASKTACVIISLNAKPLSHALSGPANLSSCGIGSFRVALEKALREALCPLASMKPRIRAVGLGVAGLEGFQDKRLVEKVVNTVLKSRSAKIVLKSDVSMALFGALEKKPGILVLAGTGSIAIGRNEAGEMMRTGGLGYLLGDEGSGFELGQRGIRAALRSADGTGPETGLLLALKTCYGLESPMDLLPLIYKSPSRVEMIARFAPQVIDLGSKGDSLAEGIFQDAVTSLLNLTLALARKLNLTKPFPLVPSGGLFQNQTFLEAFLESIEERIPQAQPVAPRNSPQMAAALLALEAIGRDYGRVALP